MRGKFVCGLLITILVSNGHAQDLPVLAIEHVNVIDVISGEVLTDRTVIVRDANIASIVDAANSQVPDNAVRIAAAGKFLIPGMWDMHIHWYDRNSMELFPINGVTGARVMSGMPLHHMWRKQFEASEFLGPHLLIASPIIDGPSPIWPGSFVATDEADGKQVVARAVENKARELFALLAENKTWQCPTLTVLRNLAYFQNKEIEFGSVTVGKQADLVILDANPLDDISNTQKIHAVILRGTLIDRRALYAKLDGFDQTKK